MADLEPLLDAVRRRFAELGPSDCRQQSFLAHLRTLGRWEAGGVVHADPGAVEFPDRLPIAFAVCSTECGGSQFIVEGGTQECQRCGDLMFRTATAVYKPESPLRSG